MTIPEVKEYWARLDAPVRLHRRMSAQRAISDLKRAATLTIRPKQITDEDMKPMFAIPQLTCKLFARLDTAHKR